MYLFQLIEWGVHCTVTTITLWIPVEVRCLFKLMEPVCNLIVSSSRLRLRVFFLLPSTNLWPPCRYEVLVFFLFNPRRIFGYMEEWKAKHLIYKMHSMLFVELALCKVYRISIGNCLQVLKNLGKTILAMLERPCFGRTPPPAGCTTSAPNLLIGRLFPYNRSFTEPPRLKLETRDSLLNLDNYLLL